MTFEETLKRHDTRIKKFEFGEDELRRCWNEKDYIGVIQEDILTDEQSAENILETIVSKVENRIGLVVGIQSLDLKK